MEVKDNMLLTSFNTVHFNGGWIFAMSMCYIVRYVVLLKVICLNCEDQLIIKINCFLLIVNITAEGFTLDNVLVPLRQMYLLN